LAVNNVEWLVQVG